MKYRLLILLLWSIAAVSVFFRPIVVTIENAQGSKLLLQGLNQQQPPLKEPFSCLSNTPLIVPAQEKVLAGIDRLQSSLGLSPGRPQAFLHLGQASCLVQDKQSAVQSFIIYTMLSPKDPWGKIQLLAAYIDLGQWSLARGVIEDPFISGNNLEVLAKDLLKNRKDIDLFLFIEKAAERFPGNRDLWSTWLSLGDAKQQNKEWSSALEIYQAGIKAQEQSNVHLARGLFYLRIGRLYHTRPELKDLHKAVLYYQKALEVKETLTQGDQTSVHLYLGDAYAALSPEYSPEQSLKEYHLALETNPKSYSAALTIGRVYLTDFQDLAQAKYYLTVANLLAPKQPYGYLYLGDVFQKEGHKQQAVEQYTEALRLKPDLEEAKKRLTALIKNE